MNCLKFFFASLTVFCSFNTFGSVQCSQVRITLQMYLYELHNILQQQQEEGFRIYSKQASTQSAPCIKLDFSVNGPRNMFRALSKEDQIIAEALNKRLVRTYPFFKRQINAIIECVTDDAKQQKKSELEEARRKF